MIDMWSFLQRAKPKDPKTNSIIKEVCQTMNGNSEASMCWALDVLKKNNYEVKKMGCSKDKIAELEEKEQELKQIECEHEYFCIHRTPTSDLKCKHCGKIITAEKYKMIYGKDILQTQIDNLTKELYNKKQELGNQQPPHRLPQEEIDELRKQKKEITEAVKEVLTQSILTKGWICPVCGCGNAPTSKICPCRNMFRTNQPWQNPVTYNTHLNCVATDGCQVNFERKTDI